MFKERRVSLDCRNAGNPAHECSDYCYTVIAEAKKRLSKGERAIHKLSLIPGMLDTRKMLMCLSERADDSLGGRVTKRNMVVAAGSSDTIAIKAKKPKSLTGTWKQDDLGLRNSKVMVVKQGGESVTSVLADDPLEENIRSEGVLPIKWLTAPQGEEGWSTPDMETYKACFGGGPYPLDTLKAFQTDLERYVKMEDREFEEKFQAQAGDLMSSLAAMRVRQSASKRHKDLLNAELEELKETVEELKDTVEFGKKELSTARSELEEKSDELSYAKGKRNQLELQVQFLKSQMSEYTANACHIFKLEKQLSEVPSYKDQVKRFMKTEAFNTIVNNYSSKSFKMGYEACASMIGEGQAFDSYKHGWDAYLAVETGKMTSAEQESVQGGEGSEAQDDEIPLHELFSENDSELQG